jgi:hypothetical protein
MSDDFFAPPAFKPEQALLELRPLAERGNTFTLRGLPVVELGADDTLLTARLAKRPAQSPEWEARRCKNSAEVRSLHDEIKKRLARWMDEPT